MVVLDVIAVDDDAGMRWLLKELLTLGGMEHVVTGSHLEAISLARARRPALAIIDVRLGGVDGVAVARTVKQLSAETEILFLTGYGDDVRASVSREDLPYELMEKPFELDALLSKVRVMCGRDAMAPARGGGEITV